MAMATFGLAGASWVCFFLAGMDLDWHGPSNETGALAYSQSA
jgi:hypothetical protein